jgi:hypothetical protein
MFPALTRCCWKCFQCIHARVVRCSGDAGKRSRCKSEQEECLRVTSKLYALPILDPKDDVPSQTVAATPGPNVQPQVHTLRHVLPVGGVHLVFEHVNKCLGVTAYGGLTVRDGFGPFTVFDLMPVPAAGDAAIFRLISASRAVVRIHNTLGEQAPYLDAVTRDPEDAQALLRLKPAEGGFIIESAVHEVCQYVHRHPFVTLWRR